MCAGALGEQLPGVKRQPADENYQVPRPAPSWGAAVYGGTSTLQGARPDCCHSQAAVSQVPNNGPCAVSKLSCQSLLSSSHLDCAAEAGF